MSRQIEEQAKGRSISISPLKQLWLLKCSITMMIRMKKRQPGSRILVRR